MTQSVTTQQISTDEMRTFTDLIYQTAGVRIPQQKITLLSNRIRRRLKATGVATYADYLVLLKRQPPSSPEWNAFLQEITTHETYLFRDEYHWSWLREKYLPEKVKLVRSGSGSKMLRFWSAAASTGDEAYSIACCVADRIPDHASWAIEIFGTDIGTGALAEAAAGEFGERAMHLVPPSDKRKFFDKAPDANSWTAKPVLKNMLKFQQHNLMKSLPQRPFDVIFVKNVLIYFDKPSKKSAMLHILRVLKPGGMLVAGPAEGVSDMLVGLERIQPWLYQSPIEPRRRQS